MAHRILQQCHFIHQNYYRKRYKAELYFMMEKGINPIYQCIISIYQSRYKKGEPIIIFSVFQCRVYDIDSKKTIVFLQKIAFLWIIMIQRFQTHLILTRTLSRPKSFLMKSVGEEDAIFKQIICYKWNKRIFENEFYISRKYSIIKVTIRREIIRPWDNQGLIHFFGTKLWNFELICNPQIDHEQKLLILHCKKSMNHTVW